MNLDYSLTSVLWLGTYDGDFFNEIQIFLRKNVHLFQLGVLYTPDNSSYVSNPFQILWFVAVIKMMFERCFLRWRQISFQRVWKQEICNRYVRWGSYLQPFNYILPITPCWKTNSYSLSWRKSELFIILSFWKWSIRIFCVPHKKLPQWFALLRNRLRLLRRWSSLW